jgi:hypothetical protein
LERLTFEGNFCDIAQCRDSACRQDGTCTQRLVWERLKAYEDAGLSPQACAEAREIEETLSGYDYSISRMVELMKADKDGRVLILPCKVGDMAYWVHNGVITGCHVYRIQVNRKGTFVFLKSTISHGGFRTDACLGKTVFLSRVEAEKALQEMEAAK